MPSPISCRTNGSTHVRQPVLTTATEHAREEQAVHQIVETGARRDVAVEHGLLEQIVLGPVDVRGDLRADPAETAPAQGRRDAALFVADAHQPAVLLDGPADVQAMCGECGVERQPLTVALDVGQRAVEVEDHGTQRLDGGVGRPADVPPERPIPTRNRHAQQGGPRHTRPTPPIGGFG